MSPFVPHSDAPVSGVQSAPSARLALPTRSPAAIRIAWESGAGYIRFGDSAVTVDSTNGIRLPSAVGVEVMRVPTSATHLAYMGCAIQLVAGEGV